MSNLGLERLPAAASASTLHRTRVGDRYVVERMRADGCNVGGEQSGHIILSDFATTGDGLLAALQVLAVLRQRDRPASEVARCSSRCRSGCATSACSSRSTWRRPRSRGLLGREQARLNGTGPAPGARLGHRAGDPRHGRGRGRGAAGRRPGDRQPARSPTSPARRLSRIRLRPCVAAALFLRRPGRCRCLGRFLYARSRWALRCLPPVRAASPAAPSPGRGFSRHHARGWNEQDHRYRSRHDEQLRRHHGGQERPRDRERGGHAHDALDGGLHRGRRGAGRHAGQAAGGDQSREHAVRGQAPDRPPLRGPRRPQGHGHGVLQDRARPTTATPGCRCATTRRRRRRSAPRSSRR